MNSERNTFEFLNKTLAHNTILSHARFVLTLLNSKVQNSNE